MPTEVLCVLLAHVVEVQGLNTSSTNFRYKLVILLEYFVKCGFFAGPYSLVLMYFGHFHYVHHHLEECMHLLQKIFI